MECLFWIAYHPYNWSLWIIDWLFMCCVPFENAQYVSMGTLKLPFWKQNRNENKNIKFSCCGFKEKINPFWGIFRFYLLSRKIYRTVKDCNEHMRNIEHLYEKRCHVKNMFKYCYIGYWTEYQPFKWLFVCLFVCLFVWGLRPTGKFFTNMETTPLPVKGCKFLPTLNTYGYWAVRFL